MKFEEFDVDEAGDSVGDGMDCAGELSTVDDRAGQASVGPLFAGRIHCTMLPLNGDAC